MIFLFFQVFVIMFIALKSFMYCDDIFFGASYANWFEKWFNNNTVFTPLNGNVTVKEILESL